MLNKPSTKRIVAFFGDREIENDAGNLAGAIGETLEHFDYEYHPGQLLVWCEFQIKRKFQYSKKVEERFKKPAIGAHTVARDTRTYLDSKWYDKHLELLHNEEWAKQAFK